MLLEPVIHRCMHKGRPPGSINIWFPLADYFISNWGPYWGKWESCVFFKKKKNPKVLQVYQGQSSQRERNTLRRAQYSPPLSTLGYLSLCKQLRPRGWAARPWWLRWRHAEQKFWQFDGTMESQTRIQGGGARTAVTHSKCLIGTREGLHLRG